MVGLAGEKEVRFESTSAMNTMSDGETLEGDRSMCDVVWCETEPVARCGSCDLDVCKEHFRPDGKCIYCSGVGMEFDHELLEQTLAIMGEQGQ